MVRFLAFLVGFLVSSLLQGQETTFTIPNPLNESWPWELVYFYADPPLKGPVQAEVRGELRPAQTQQVTEDGQSRQKVWTVVTILPENPKDDVSKVKVTLRPGQATGGLQLSEKGDVYEIDNGVFTARIAKYPGKFPVPLPLSDIPHWMQGLKVKGSNLWDGRGRFEGSARFRAARTEILQQGPVLIDFRIVLESDEPDSNEQVEAQPLALGKQTYKWKPNQIPTELTAKRQNHYEALVRIVMGDPWIDVNERYHFQRDPSVQDFGIAQYHLEWGGPQGVPFDTVMWHPWFEYDSFGASDSMKFHPVRPRPTQKGRPFVLMRPRWNQGPGGGQDFFLTIGGETPRRDRKTGELTAQKIDPQAPAMGLYAAYPSKWVGPYPATLAAYAKQDGTASVRFPMTDGERSGKWYGQRAYGLCAGPRREFHDTGKLHSMVRRHTDWTLVALIHKYILNWRRDPSKAGPHAIITREELKNLRDQVARGAQTPAVAIIREAQKILEEIQAQEAEARKKVDEAKAAMNAAEGEAKEKAKAVFDQARQAHRSLSKQIQSVDSRLINLLTGGEVPKVKPPSSMLWRTRRYQSDFLNPTQRPTRDIKNFSLVDLFADGQPVGGADQAALGYIITDLDSWPGWHNGWRPGNPNFHTDKYMGAIFIGAALRDHPHADEWLEFGRLNYMADLEKVILPPDGVGYECPGYSGYSLGLQLEIGRILMNCGLGNPFKDFDLIMKTAEWHRKLLTPYTTRLGFRHEAPHGDTHRWKSGMGKNFGVLARFYRDTQPEFAAKMMGTWRMLEANGYELKRDERLKIELLAMDPSVPATPPEKMDWSSQAFEGFGTISRHHFGTPRESFLSLRGGFTEGHYHNDQMAFHFIAGQTPISMDYNCSYSPRGDHAALHNTMTFGNDGQIMNNSRQENVPTMEQIFGKADLLAFVSQPTADVSVMQRQANRLSQDPVFPKDHEFQRRYPSRSVSPIVYRRTVAFVKHPADSPLQDYLVVREETLTDQPQQMNLHLHARELKDLGDGLWQATGQWDKDMLVFLAEATEPRVEERSWHYLDPWMFGPLEDYALREGETQTEWKNRMEALMKKHSVNELPLPGFKPIYQKPEKNQAWFDRVSKTGGRALMPPPGWNAPWHYGEFQLWLRVHTAPGTPMLWALVPYSRDGATPKLERIPQGLRVSADSVVDEIRLLPDGQITLTRNGQSAELLPAGRLPALQATADQPQSEETPGSMGFEE